MTCELRVDPGKTVKIAITGRDPQRVVGLERTALQETGNALPVSIRQTLVYHVGGDREFVGDLHKVAIQNPK